MDQKQHVPVMEECACSLWSVYICPHFWCFVVEPLMCSEGLASICTLCGTPDILKPSCVSFGSSVCWIVFTTSYIHMVTSCGMAGVVSWAIPVMWLVPCICSNHVCVYGSTQCGCVVNGSVAMAAVWVFIIGNQLLWHFLSCSPPLPLPSLTPSLPHSLNLFSLSPPSLQRPDSRVTIHSDTSQTRQTGYQSDGDPTIQIANEKGEQGEGWRGGGGGGGDREGWSRTWIQWRSM